jgi:hypothetical protein
MGWELGGPHGPVETNRRVRWCEGAATRRKGWRGRPSAGRWMDNRNEGFRGDGATSPRPRP